MLYASTEFHIASSQLTWSRLETRADAQADAEDAMLESEDEDGMDVTKTRSRGRRSKLNPVQVCND